MTTAATNLLKSASESDVHGARGEGGRAVKTAKRVKAETHTAQKEGGRERVISPPSSSFLDVRPSARPSVEVGTWKLELR